MPWALLKWVHCMMQEAEVTRPVSVDWGNSLAVQWLELGAFTVVAWVQALVKKQRFFKPCSTAKQNKTKQNKTRLGRQYTHSMPSVYFHAAAAAAKSLQSCPTLCDRIDGSPPGSPVPGTLQARTLEWVAICILMSSAFEWLWISAH